MKSRSFCWCSLHFFRVWKRLFFDWSPEGNFIFCYRNEDIYIYIYVYSDICICIHMSLSKKKAPDQWNQQAEDSPPWTTVFFFFRCILFDLGTDVISTMFMKTDFRVLFYLVLPYCFDLYKVLDDLYGHGSNISYEYVFGIHPLKIVVRNDLTHTHVMSCLVLSNMGFTIYDIKLDNIYPLVN